MMCYWPKLTGSCVCATGRKLKRFGALKSLGLAPSLMFQSHLAMAADSQALTSMSCIPGIREVQLSQQIINILENIEPDIMYSGYDNSQSDVPHLLLTSLNRLCEKQLLWIVKWSKSLPGNGPLSSGPPIVTMAIHWLKLSEREAMIIGSERKCSNQTRLCRVNIFFSFTRIS